MKDAIRDVLLKKEEELFGWKKQLEKNLAEAPMGKLYRSKSNGSEQYYIRKPDANGKIRKKYVRKSEKMIVDRILQRDYEALVLEKVKEQISSIEKFLKEFVPEELTAIYENLPCSQKKIITPWMETTEEYVRKWKNVLYVGKDFSQSAQEIFTERGERVRSKSEKIIADSLYRQGVPYRYEYPIYLRGMGTVYPDFMCLHVRRRKEILWEHMGMMSDAAYCKNALKKEEIYIKNGYRTGIDIIYTHESSEYTLSTKVIDQIIKDVFS